MLVRVVGENVVAEPATLERRTDLRGPMAVGARWRVRSLEQLLLIL